VVAAPLSLALPPVLYVWVYTDTVVAKKKKAPPPRKREEREAMTFSLVFLGGCGL
jgi:hypothetical protein